MANGEVGGRDWKAGGDIGVKKSILAGNEGENGDEGCLIGGHDGGIEGLIIGALDTRFLPVIILKSGMGTMLTTEMIWILLVDYQQSVELVRNVG